MGQKTNPKGFRLVTNQKHLSNWYSTKILYSKLIEEDFLIRQKTNEFFQDFLTISDIRINRLNSQNGDKELVAIEINALFPRAKEMYKKINRYLLEDVNISKLVSRSFGISLSKLNLKTITSFLLKRKTRELIRFLQLRTTKNYFIKINFIKNTFEDSTLIAKYISDQLEKRVQFKRVIKQTIKKVNLTLIKGIKVEVSGRLNGIEIARSEWKRDGKIPLHTLKANIDYAQHIAKTVHGIIGIKIWLFKG